MIHLYTWNTPNGIKPLIFAEEAALPYELHPIDISSGVQHDAAYRSVNPNQRIPALIDDERTGDAAVGDVRGLRVFESGAMLVYLARRVGRFLPTECAAEAEVLGWTFWQVGGLGPMVGQLHWFAKNDPDGTGAKRYREESAKCLDVLERRLDGREFLADDYSIADMMCWAWAKAGVDAVGGDRPALAAWIERIGTRPAVTRAKARADGLKRGG